MTTEQTPVANTVQSPEPPRGPKLLFIAVTLSVAVISLIVGVLIGPLIQNQLHRKNTADSDDKTTGTWYISQMHPWIIQPNPGTCPICGMDLVPISPDRFTGEIAIDPVIVQNMGVRVAQAQYGFITRSIRTIGTVQVDESLVTDVVQRFGGYVEQVFVTAMWNKVEAGSPLFKIYSPQVFAAEQEYIIALSNKDSSEGAVLLAAAEKKLILLGIPADEIERLKKDGTAASSIVVTSPVTGYVWQKNINEGSEVTPKTVAYRLADLSSVWIEATLYEDQLPFISAEQSARIRLNYGDEEQFTGTVSHLYPAVDARTREIRARFTFANRMTNTGPRLRPGMFATIFIEKQSDHEYVTIPREAVIGTGDRHVVFVSLGRGKFSPRNVQIGPISNDGIIGIRSGIEAGESVVTSGQFLLDSESKMREALAKIMKGNLASEQMPVGGKAEPVELAPLNDETRTAWRHVLEQYLILHGDLYENKTNQLNLHVQALVAAAEAFITVGKNQDEHFHHRFEDVATLAQQVKTLDGASLEKLRPGYGSISITLNQLVKIFGQPHELPQPIVGMRCSMAKGIPEKGVWLQTGAVVKNPYYGATSDMRDCMAESWQLPVITEEQGTKSNNTEPTSPIITPPTTTPPTTTPEPDKTHNHEHGAAAPATTNESQADNLNKAIIQQYYALQQAFFKNDIAATKNNAQLLQHGFHSLGAKWQKPMQQSEAITQTDDIKIMRQHFGEMSVFIKNYLEKNGLHETGVTVFRCGMARDFADKGVWLQLNNVTPMNPYFGSEHGMADCAKQIWAVTHNGLQVVK